MAAVAAGDVTITDRKSDCPSCSKGEAPRSQNQVRLYTCPRSQRLKSLCHWSWLQP
jgi:hypothetical protein